VIFTAATVGVLLSSLAARPLAKRFLQRTLVVIGFVVALSRSISNLGSSLGTAVAGTILVAGLANPKRSYGIAMVTLGAFGLVGLGAIILLPKADPIPPTDS
jgi:hypothetical protein